MQRVEQTASCFDVERTIVIEAAPEDVFPYLIEADRMVRWMGVEAALEAEPGGDFRCEVTPGWVARGTFVAVEPPHRVTFTFGWDRDEADEPPPGSTTVTIDLAPHGPDATQVTLRQTGLASEELQRAHDEGWEHYLGRLGMVASGVDPGADPWASEAG